MKKLIEVCGVLLLFLILATSGGAASLAEKSRELAEQNVGGAVAGVDGWLFLKEELQHLAAGKFWGEAAANASLAKEKSIADPFKAITTYNKLLAERGITLFLMPVPPKALIYPDKLAKGLLPGSGAEAQALYKAFYGELAGAGVKVIDLLPKLVANRDKAQLYCRTDSHFSGAGLELFAAAAAEAVQKEGWYQGVAKKEFAATKLPLKINGDLRQMAGGTGIEEEIELQVFAAKADGKQLEGDPNSPVILLGDSHTLVFQAGGDLHAKGAGLFDHLSAKLGFAVDLLGVRGSGVTPARIKLFQRAKQDPNYLAGKKALVWCFAAREFTGAGGWKEIPVAP
jgi:SGNH hydrolase-like domain, acetyltransferase AlgX